MKKYKCFRKIVLTNKDCGVIINSTKQKEIQKTKRFLKEEFLKVKFNILKVRKNFEIRFISDEKGNKKRGEKRI